MTPRYLIAILTSACVRADAFSTNSYVSKRTSSIASEIATSQLRSTANFDTIYGTESTTIEDLDLSNVDTLEIKRRLLDLLPRMMGTAEEFKEVESYVNKLEDRYTSIQTLDFLNLAMSGEWQLLFSTNLSGGPKSNFRLKELFQRIESNSLEGTVENEAAWDLAEDGTTFDATGIFTVRCSYKINQGSRMIMNLEENVLKLGKGSVVPKDVESLIGFLNRAMPNELFDPNDHAMDTTYLDGDLRIVRITGPRFEGVRDIFIRRGSMEINPV